MDINNKARIHWACRRGMRELDISIMPFFEHEYDTLSDADKVVFIRLLECDEEFTALNYELTDFIDKNGDSRPEYLISKDGMVFLVMGFTGKKAAQFKLLYIRAFNWMMEQLHENRDLQHLLHDFTRREAVSVANGTLHGQGLARRRIEKHALSHEQAVIHAKLQLCLNLIGEEAA